MRTGKFKLTTIIFAFALLGVLPPLRAATMSLLPTQWNTISSLFPTSSDGAGYHSYVGGGRETLLGFDFSSIPTASTITSAVLTMYMDRSNGSGSQPVFVYRLTSSWGMGTSGAGQVDNGIVGGGGSGYTATNNDATWTNRFYNATTPASSIGWNAFGGDYAPTVSAYTLVGSGIPTTGTPGPGGPLLATWSSTSGLVSDVQGWLDGTIANDGWILNDYASASDYPPSGSTLAADQPRRFIMPANSLNGSGTNPNDLPNLTVTFAPVPEPGIAFVAAIAALWPLLRRSR